MNQRDGDDGDAERSEGCGSFCSRCCDGDDDRHDYGCDAYSDFDFGFCCACDCSSGGDVKESARSVGVNAAIGRRRRRSDGGNVRSDEIEKMKNEETGNGNGSESDDEMERGEMEEPDPVSVDANQQTLPLELVVVVGFLLLFPYVAMLPPVASVVFPPHPC